MLNQFRFNANGVALRVVICYVTRMLRNVCKFKEKYSLEKNSSETLFEESVLHYSSPTYSCLEGSDHYTSDRSNSTKSPWNANPNPNPNEVWFPPIRMKKIIIQCCCENAGLRCIRLPNTELDLPTKFGKNSDCVSRRLVLPPKSLHWTRTATSCCGPAVNMLHFSSESTIMWINFRAAVFSTAPWLSQVLFPFFLFSMP